MDGARGGSADGCTVCHATGMGTAGAYAARTAMSAAIANGDYRCVSCHFETTDAAGTTGVQAPHKSTEKIANAPLGTTAEWAAAAIARVAVTTPSELRSRRRALSHTARPSTV